MLKKLNIILSLIFICTFTIIGFTQDLTPKKLNGKWGFVNADLEWIIKPKFQSVKGFTEGVAAAQQKGKWGFINSDGKWKIKPAFGNVKSFQEGYAAVLSLEPIYNETTRSLSLQWGYIDLNGLYQIPYKFRDASSFENGKALVSEWDMHPKSYFYINTEGDEIFPPHIKKTAINKRLFYVENILPNNNKTYCYADFDSGKLTNWFVNDFFQDTFPQLVYLPKKIDSDTLPDFDLIGDFKKTLVAFLDKDLKIASPWYEEIGKLSLGYRAVRFNHKWGIVDEHFSIITPPKFIGFQLLKPGTYNATMQIKESYLCNEKGEIKSDQSDRFENFDNDFVLGVYAINNHTFYSLFNNIGQQRSDWYNEIFPIHNHAARVVETFPARSEKFVKEIDYYNYIESSHGFVLSTWRRVVTTEWKARGKFRDSALQFLYAPNSNCTITPEFFETTLTKNIKIEGNKLIFAGSDFNNGLALVSISSDSLKFTVKDIEYASVKQKQGYINWYGKIVIPCKFEEGFDFSDGKAIIKKGNKYGAIDISGRVIIAPKFELMGNFGNGLAPVYIDTAWGFVNSIGKVVIQPQFDDIRPFKNAYAAVKIDKKWGLINQQGTLILPCQYNKPPVALKNKKIRVLINGVGYKEIDIPS